VALNSAIKGRCRAVIRLFLLSAFAAIVGILGGRIVSAVILYKALGWTAMWIELGAWSPLS